MNPTYSSAGATLSYRNRGAGLPVVFLHPTPLDHDYWSLLVDRLPDVHAIALDLRGHGASELGDLPTGGFSLVPDAPVLSMEQYATDVVALLDHLHLHHVVFAGCSVGGYVLLELWRRIPHRIKALAFVCSKPQADGEAALARRVESIAKARSGGLGAIFDGMSQSLVSEHSRQRHPGITSEVRSSMRLTPEAFVATRPDSLPTVSTITVPVLAIVGGADTAVTPAEMEVFQAVKPFGCEYHVLKNAGHFAAYEEPDQVAEIFSDWFLNAEINE